MITWDAGKSEYTEVEAALAMNISVRRLRELVRDHVMSDPEASLDIPVPNLRPTDMLLLRMLADQNRAA